MSSFERGSSWATSSHAVQTETKEFSVPRSSVSEGRWFTVWFVFLSGRKEFDLWFVFNLFCLMSIHVLHLVGPMRLKLSFSASRHRLCGGRVPPRARWRHQPLSIGAGFAPKFLSLLILVDMVSHTGISPQPPLNQLAASHGAQWFTLNHHNFRIVPSLSLYNYIHIII